MNSQLDADVLIVGGGLVGAALALALKDSALSVLLLDERDIPPPAAAGSWDSRVYAINGASRRWLERIGAWQCLDLQRLQPVQNMRIRGDAGGVLDFAAPEAGLAQLATILESRELQCALGQALQACGNVTQLRGVAASGVTIDAEAASLALADGRCLRSRLLVGADGAQSWLRGALAIAPQVHDYRQFGVVANFELERPHYATACQWFRADGVLAWLPLPGDRISIVWSCPENLKDELLGLDAQDFARRVAAAGAEQFGALRLITSPQAFPLRLNHVPGWVSSRVALVGDAAHTVHPLAGQGVNLGFGDVAELAGILRSEAVEYCGDLRLLRRYERARREPVYAMQAFCHGLIQLFNNDNLFLRAARNLGLGLTNQSEWLKRQLVRQAENY